MFPNHQETISVIDLVKGRWGGSGEVGGEEAERLVLVGGQRRAVAVEGARDAAAGGARAVAEGLDAAFPLQLCRGGERGRGGEERDLRSDVSIATTTMSQRLEADPLSAQLEPER